MTTHTHSTVAILSIGDELTLGQKLDTNAQWLSAQLAERGVVPMVHVTVADGLAVLTERIKRLAADHDLVITTGGLGPTADDLTRQALAGAMGVELVEDAEALANLIRRFESAGLTMAKANLVQAMRPISAKCLDNPKGTAPGLHGVVHGADIFCLPGPPSEMKPMFIADVTDALRPARTIMARVLPTVGIGESAMADKLGDLMDRGRNPLVGTTASASIVSIRLRYEGDDERECGRLLDETEALVAEKVGKHIFARQDRSLTETVVKLLIEQGNTLATVESCTGGMVGQRLTAIAGSSVAYVGGFVTYTNEMKVSQVGVHQETLSSHGAVSEETCKEMTAGGLDRTGATHSIAVTGIAGPGGGSAEKPVGTVWIGVAARTGEYDIRQFRFTGDRDQVRQRSATMALAMLWGMLTGKTRLELFWESKP